MAKPTLPQVSTIADLRHAVSAARQQKQSIHFVPTMGALHPGHASLIEQAHAAGRFVVVSIFVNPSQFGPKEDLAKYPRTLAKDIEMCQAAGADLVYTPTEHEVYPRGVPTASQAWPSTFVEVPGISDTFEGAIRPGHFRGVATIVLKLFNQCGADVAYFGQKDAQQVAVLRSMVHDLDVPTKLVICPTKREADGLAMSSRNVYLSPVNRQNATVIYKALSDAKLRVKEGEKNVTILKALMKEMLDVVPGCQRDYVDIVHAMTYQPMQQIEPESLAIVAARFAHTRLIDNMFLHPGTRVS